MITVEAVTMKYGSFAAVDDECSKRFRLHVSLAPEPQNHRSGSTAAQRLALRHERNVDQRNGLSARRLIDARSGILRPNAQRERKRCCQQRRAPAHGLRPHPSNVWCVRAISRSRNQYDQDDQQQDNDDGRRRDHQ